MTLIVSSCCSTSMLICESDGRQQASPCGAPPTHLVEHLRQLGQGLFNLFNVLVTLLDLLERAAGVAVAVGAQQLGAGRISVHVDHGSPARLAHRLGKDLRVVGLEHLLDLFGRRVRFDWRCCCISRGIPVEPDPTHQS